MAALIYSLPAVAGEDASPAVELPGLLAGANAAKGETLFKHRCRACHTNT